MIITARPHFYTVLQILFQWHKEDIAILFTLECACYLYHVIINLQHARAARVTVLGLPVCVCVCLLLFALKAMKWHQNDTNSVKKALECKPLAPALDAIQLRIKGFYSILKRTRHYNRNPKTISYIYHTFLYGVTQLVIYRIISH